MIFLYSCAGLDFFGDDLRFGNHDWHTCFFGMAEFHDRAGLCESPPLISRSAIHGVVLFLKWSWHCSVSLSVPSCVLLHSSFSSSLLASVSLLSFCLLWSGRLFCPPSAGFSILLFASGCLLTSFCRFWVESSARLLSSSCPVSLLRCSSLVVVAWPRTLQLL